MFEAMSSNERMDQAIRDAKTVLSEKIEDGRIAAERILKRGQAAVENAVEDGMTQAVRQVKRNPGPSLAVAFGTGAIMGILAVHLGKRMIEE